MEFFYDVSKVKVEGFGFSCIGVEFGKFIYFIVNVKVVGKGKLDV